MREAGNKSTLICPEKIVTDNSYRNRQWILQSKSQNGCELSQLWGGHKEESEAVPVFS